MVKMYDTGSVHHSLTTRYANYAEESLLNFIETCCPVVRESSCLTLILNAHKKIEKKFKHKISFENVTLNLNISTSVLGKIIACEGL